MKYLETKRFVLREFIQADCDHLFELDSDPEVMKWLTNGVPSSRKKIEDRLVEISEMMKKYNHLFGMWAAIEKSSGAFLGWFHLRPAKDDVDNQKRVELGYRFFRRYWGQGFATEGSRALIAKAFDDLDVSEVFATTMAKNLASRSVLEKLGFMFSHEYYDEHFPIKEEKAVHYLLKKKS